MGLRGPKPGDAGYRPPKPRKQRILDRIEIDEAGCWNWTGPRDPKGYGKSFFGSRVDGTRCCLKTHRVAYEEWVGPIPQGMTIDHKCENKSCCNPEHLQVVTNAENCGYKRERWATCHRGHPRTPENTKMEGTRTRCLVCQRLTTNAYKRRRRAEGRPVS